MTVIWTNKNGGYIKEKYVGLQTTYYYVLSLWLCVKKTPGYKKCVGLKQSNEALSCVAYLHLGRADGKPEVTTCCLISLSKHLPQTFWLSKALTSQNY